MLPPPKVAGYKNQHPLNSIRVSHCHFNGRSTSFAFRLSFDMHGCAKVSSTRRCTCITDFCICEVQGQGRHCSCDLISQDISNTMPLTVIRSDIVVYILRFSQRVNNNRGCEHAMLSCRYMCRYRYRAIVQVHFIDSERGNRRTWDVSMFRRARLEGYFQHHRRSSSDCDSAVKHARHKHSDAVRISCVWRHRITVELTVRSTSTEVTGLYVSIYVSSIIMSVCQ